MAATIDELKSQLTNAKNNFVLGLAGMYLLSEDACRETLCKGWCSFGAKTFDFGQVAGLLDVPADKEIALKEFLLSHHRALIKETFELIKDYCSTTNQFNKFTAWPTYRFFRVIRNCVSHNFVFDFQSSELKHLPVTWRGIEINASHHGQPLQIAFLGYDGMYGLFEDAYAFVESELT